MDTSKATPEFFAALAEAQAAVENATKASTNPHFKSKYADLAEVLNTVRPVFATHGLSVIQSADFDGQCVVVTTVLGHASGGHVSSTMRCVPAKLDAQGVGSCTTYLRRYSLAAMCGVAQEDDDGNSAMHNTPPRPQATAAHQRVQQAGEPRVTEDTLAKLLPLFAATGKQGTVLAHYGVTRPHELSEAQAQEAVRRLSVTKAQEQANAGE